MRRILATAIGTERADVIEAETLGEARSFDADGIAAVILDLDLHDGDGLTLLRDLRESSDVPVLAVSARATAHGAAIEAGADDFLAKPCSVPELRTRMAVVLTARLQEVVIVGPLYVDLVRGDVTLDGRTVDITAIEKRLLCALARRSGAMTYRQLVEVGWGTASAVQHDVVRVHVASLRRKLEKDPARPRWLVAEPGVGYRLRRG